MPTKTNWKQIAEQRQEQIEQLQQELARVQTTVDVVVKDKEQAEKELSTKRTENSVLLVQLERLTDAIRQAQETNNESGELAEVIPLEPSDTEDAVG